MSRQASGHHKRASKRKDGKLAALRRKHPLDDDDDIEDNSLLRGRDTNLTEEEIQAEEERVRSKAQGRGDGGHLLTGKSSAEITADLKLLQQATRKGWNVRRKQALRRRLEDIAMKTEAEVVVRTKDDVFKIKSETKADEIAIQATKVLVQMDAQDVNRIKAADQPILPPQQTTVNVHVSLDERRLALAQLAHKLGARSLSINGAEVPVAGLLGGAVPVSEHTGDNGEAS